MLVKEEGETVVAGEKDKVAGRKKPATKVKFQVQCFMRMLGRPFGTRVRCPYHASDARIKALP
jgi:hypothetical protein